MPQSLRGNGSTDNGPLASLDLERDMSSSQFLSQSGIKMMLPLLQ